MRYFVEGAPEGGPTRLGVIMDDGTEHVRDDVQGIASEMFARMANAYAGLTMLTPRSAEEVERGF